MKKITKHFAVLTALITALAVCPITAYAENTNSNQPQIDADLVLAPETRLNVYVDGQWSDTLSDSYGFGDTVTITAPSTSGGKSFAYWQADGSVISYNKTLKLTMNAHTTLYAVYASNTTAKPTAGFTSITLTNDGSKISFQAIASGDTAGIVYSTTATGSNLKIGGTGVINVAAEKLTDSTQTMPKSVLDKNNCWMLQITPDKASTVYHARAYVTINGTTTYGDVKNVKLSDLENGVSMVANLDGFDPEGSLQDALAGLTSGMKTVTFDANGGTGTMASQAVLSGKAISLRKNTFTRSDYIFIGWNTKANGTGTSYSDGQSVTLSEDTTLYAQYKLNNPQAVTKMIDALPDKITAANQEAVKAARAAYDALDSDETSKVSKETLAKLVAAEKAVADHIAADDVIAKIKKIGEVALTDTSKAMIDAARTAYEALKDDQKALVENIAELDAKEDSYSALQVEDVKTKINDIGDVELTTASKSAIKAARTAYDKLSSEQKALVPNAIVLTYAEKLYDALETAEKAEEDKTAAEKAQAEAEKAQAEAEEALENGEKDAAKKVAAAEAAQKAAEEARKVAEAAREKAESDAAERIAAAEAAQKSAEEAKVAAEKVAQEATDKAVAAAVAQAAAEEALANGEKDAAEKGAAAETAQKAAEEAKAAAEQSAKEAADKLEAAEAVQKALEDALAKAESDAAEKKAAAEAAQKTAEAKAAAAEDSEKDAVEKAAAAEAAQKAAKEALANSEADAAEKVAAAEAAQKAAEEAAAKAEADKAAADQAAQDAADAQKNAEAAAEQAEADRIAAEAAKAEAEKKAAEEKAAADKEAADKVMASIDAIGKVKKTDDCRDSIVGARAAYDLLTEEQQKLVTNLDVLESAEKKYEALPQTGYSGLYKAVAAVAALLGITGIALVKKSRKEDEEE